MATPTYRVFDPLLPQGIAAAMLLVLAVRHLRGRGEHATCASRVRTGLALWSFLMATAHGAGLMLVPVLLGRYPSTY